jgi:hypothetical protein
MTNPTEETEGTHPGKPSGTNRQTIPNHSGKGHEASGYAHQIQEKVSGRNDIPPEALSAGHTKRMESENEAFSFYPVGKSSRKTLNNEEQSISDVSLGNQLANTIYPRSSCRSTPVLVRQEPAPESSSDLQPTR